MVDVAFVVTGWCSYFYTEKNNVLFGYYKAYINKIAHLYTKFGASEKKNTLLQESFIPINIKLFSKFASSVGVPTNRNFHFNLNLLNEVFNVRISLQ